MKTVAVSKMFYIVCFQIVKGMCYMIWKHVKPIIVFVLD